MRRSAGSTMRSSWQQWRGEIRTGMAGRVGAGPGCSGQVLVLYDMLGIYPGKQPRFVRNFMTGAAGIDEAIAGYVRAVKDGTFPGSEHYV